MSMHKNEIGEILIQFWIKTIKIDKSKKGNFNSESSTLSKFFITFIKIPVKRCFTIIFAMPKSLKFNEAKFWSISFTLLPAESDLYKSSCNFNNSFRFHKKFFYEFWQWGWLSKFILAKGGCPASSKNEFLNLSFTKWCSLKRHRKIQSARQGGK